MKPKTSIRNDFSLSQFRQEFSKQFISLDDDLYERIYHATRCEEPVLILGPTGTGKELIANAIKDYGVRRDKSFIAVNCALIPKEHLYSELFGVEKGAYTGVQKRNGLFKEADKGTIFLDEIGDLPVDAQGGLLRVLETGKIRQLGQLEKKASVVNVRIIAATNKDLLNSETFRHDLLQRLKVIPIYLDSLSSRIREIPYMLQKILNRHNIKYVDFHFYLFCLTNSWNGNVRELENFCKYAIQRSEMDTVSLYGTVYGFYKKTGYMDSDDIHFFNDKCFVSPNDLLGNTPTKDFMQTPDFHFAPESKLHSPELIFYYALLRFLLEHVDQTKLKKYFRLKIQRNMPDEYKIFPNKKLYIFPKISLSDIPEINPDNLLFSPLLSDSKKGQFMINLTGEIINLKVKFLEHQRRKLIRKELFSRSKKFKNMLRKYWIDIFNQYGHLPNSQIAKITGISDKTIKKKRYEYSSN